MENSGNGRSPSRGGTRQGDSLMSDIQAEMEINAMLREEELRRAQEQIELEKATARQIIEINQARALEISRIQEQAKREEEQREREVEIPSPIPNLVVKHFIADNTAGSPGVS